MSNNKTMDSLNPDILFNGYNPFKDRQKGQRLNEEQLLFIKKLIQEKHWSIYKICKIYKLGNAMKERIKERFISNDWSPLVSTRNMALTQEELNQIKEMF